MKTGTIAALAVGVAAVGVGIALANKSTATPAQQGGAGGTGPSGGGSGGGGTPSCPPGFPQVNYQLTGGQTVTAQSGGQCFSVALLPEPASGISASPNNGDVNLYSQGNPVTGVFAGGGSTLTVSWTSNGQAQMATVVFGDGGGATGGGAPQTVNIDQQASVSLSVGQQVTFQMSTGAAVSIYVTAGGSALSQVGTSNTFAAAAAGTATVVAIDSSGNTAATCTVSVS